MNAEITLLMTSFITANFMHAYLLYRQRDSRKQTISHHATKNRRTHGWYIAGHLVAGTTFYMFARRYFSDTPHAKLLLLAATIGYVADIIQAFIPAKGSVEKYHEFFAYTMAISVIFIGILVAFTIPQPLFTELISRSLAICLALSIPASIFINNKFFYRVQMISLATFYTELIVVVIGTK